MIRWRSVALVMVLLPLSALCLVEPGHSQGEVLIDETFSSPGLPEGFDVPFGTASVTPDGLLRIMGGGCVTLPGSYDRLRGLLVEADINITWGAAGDFMFQMLYDDLIDIGFWCVPKTDGFVASVYPAGSDNPINILQERVGGAWSGFLSTSLSILQAGQWAHLVMKVAEDGGVTVSLDGTEVLDGSVQAAFGGISMRAWGTVYVDNLLVRTNPSCEFGAVLTFVRATGRPQWEETAFESCGGDGILTVAADSVSSATVYLNGELVALPSDFNMTSEGFSVPVTLESGENLVVVKVAGNPAATMSLTFEEE